MIILYILLSYIRNITKILDLDGLTNYRYLYRLHCFHAVLCQQVHHTMTSYCCYFSCPHRWYECPWLRYWRIDNDSSILYLWSLGCWLGGYTRRHFSRSILGEDYVFPGWCPCNRHGLFSSLVYAFVGSGVLYIIPSASSWLRLYFTTAVIYTFITSRIIYESSQPWFSLVQLSWHRPIQIRPFLRRRLWLWYYFYCWRWIKSCCHVRPSTASFSNELV